MMRQWRLGVFLALGMAGILLGGTKKEICQAAVKKDGFTILKQILEEPGEARVELNDTIYVRETIHVRGKKTLYGNGCRIKRGKTAGRVFGGTLFSVTGGKFTLSHAIVCGEGTRQKIYGRLVEVRKGTFVLGKKGVLKNNCNTGSKEEGGGAVRVCSLGKFLMKAGEIKGNETVTEGAAVYIENGGKFLLKGGMIQENKSRGIGVVEGFDGRGGAIYNNGLVTISGGLIRKNYAVGYFSKKSEYGGAGGMLFNCGKCVITGGTIKDNVSSYGGGAIYSDRGSSLRILGGTFSGNQANRGRTIFFCGKSCFLDAGLKKTECYMGDRSKIQKRGQFQTSKPEGKKKKEVVFHIKKFTRVYYTGENLKEKNLQYGVRAEKRGTNVSQKIHLIHVSGIMEKQYERKKQFDTGRPGKGRLFFSAGGSVVSVPYKIKENTAPDIAVAPRFLFTWEIWRYTDQRWRDMLSEGIRIQDGEDNSLELWKRVQIKWYGLKSRRAGKYRIHIKLTDQWGHRFYMKKGEKRRYGSGRLCEVEIPVTLVETDSASETAYGVVRFCPVKEEVDKPVQEWHFSEEDICGIKQYMKACEDPFSSSVNDYFIDYFGLEKGLEKTGG